MQLHLLSADEITVKKNRQRRELDQTKIFELAASIGQVGLIHPIVVRSVDGEYTLVAGERRLKALEQLWFLGSEVTYSGKVIPEGQVPCSFLGEIDPIDAEEIELEENIRREDLNWKERADAVARLAALRTAQAKRANLPAPSVADIAEEVSGHREGDYQGDVRKDIILGNALKDPEAAAALDGATNRNDAFKRLRRHEESKRNAALGASLVLTSEMHTLRKGNCIPLMQEMPAETFDVILCDPPYGVGADEFSDSGGRTAGGHFYSDSYEEWKPLATSLAGESYRLAKGQAHAYVFCDIDRFGELKALFAQAGWSVFRTPLVWVKPGGVRAPWPEMGPQRKYEIILFAVKGKRPVTRLYGDVLTYPSDPNLGHPAQKPVALLSDLLQRSVRPGDTVLDPFCGTGSTLVAAHQHKCRATGIELNEAAYGISLVRVRELK